jgi:hypothetical protein
MQLKKGTMTWCVSHMRYIKCARVCVCGGGDCVGKSEGVHDPRILQTLCNSQKPSYVSPVGVWDPQPLPGLARYIWARK